MADTLSPFSPPRISRAQFVRVMRGYGAPAAARAEADACYAAIVAAGVDPAVGLAFAVKEHSLAWRGVSARTRGWGNVIAAALDGNVTRPRSIGRDGRFAVYATYADGAADWAEYLVGRYQRRGIDDLDRLIAIYAPANDGNDPAGYAATVRRLVPQWVAQDPEPVAAPDPWAGWGALHPLPDAERGHGIPQRWLAEQLAGRGLGAAITPEMHADGCAARAFVRGVIIWRADGDQVEVRR